jgi:hypothetical protein
VLTGSERGRTALEPTTSRRGLGLSVTVSPRGDRRITFRR